MTSKYYTNRRIKNKIDNYLKMNASMWANLGTKGKFDVGSKTIAKNIWISILHKIKNLDPVFWNAIKKDDD